MVGSILVSYILAGSILAGSILAGSILAGSILAGSSLLLDRFFSNLAEAARLPLMELARDKLTFLAV